MVQPMTLIKQFPLLIGEDLFVLLTPPSNRSAFIPSNRQTKHCDRRETDQNPKASPISNWKPGWGGGGNALNPREGGELAPKVAPLKLGLLTPKLTVFYRISVERGQFQEPLEIRKFSSPPLNFGDLIPPTLLTNKLITKGKG